MSDGLRAGPASGHAVSPRVWRSLAVLTGCIAAAAMIALVSHVVPGTHRDPSAMTAMTPEADISTGAPASASTHALAHWVHANLPSSTTVLADPTATDVLRGVGTTAATDNARTCRAGTIVLVTAALRLKAHKDATLQACLDHSYPIALQGNDEVREIATDLPAAMHARAAALGLQRRGVPPWQSIGRSGWLPPCVRCCAAVVSTCARKPSSATCPRDFPCDC